MPLQTKLIFILSVLIFVFCSCSQVSKAENDKTAEYKPLRGSWQRENSEGSTLIEIIDTSMVFIHQFLKREPGSNGPVSDSIWYYKYEGTMGYRDSSTIWISTDNFRFYYKLKGDTLIELDNKGDQGVFIKKKNEHMGVKRYPYS